MASGVGGLKGATSSSSGTRNTWRWRPATYWKDNKHWEPEAPARVERCPSLALRAPKETSQPSSFRSRLAPEGSVYDRRRLGSHRGCPRPQTARVLPQVHSQLPTVVAGKAAGMVGCGRERIRGQP